jgi:hypothetical protein
MEILVFIVGREHLKQLKTCVRAFCGHSSLLKLTVSTVYFFFNWKPIMFLIDLNVAPHNTPPF